MIDSPWRACLSNAGRTIAFHSETGLRTAQNALPRRGISALVRRPKRRPLDEGVHEYDGEIVLAREAQPDKDPGLVLRIAAASASTGLPIGAGTLRRLADSAPDLPTPWPREALDDLLVVLLAGPTAGEHDRSAGPHRAMGPVIAGMGCGPRPSAARRLAQMDRGPSYRRDRRQCGPADHSGRAIGLAGDRRAAARHRQGAGRRSLRVRGRPGDPDRRAAGPVAPGRRHDLRQWCATTCCCPSRPAAATSTTPRLFEGVAEALGGDPQLLELLHALAEADSKATGPGVWSDWKASLMADLVRRCRLLMAGEPLPQAEPTTPHYLSLAADHGVHVEITPSGGERCHAVMVAPDARGLMSKAAAVLALNSLRIHSASVNVHEGVAIAEFVVSPLFGSPPGADLLRQQFVGALKGDVDVLGMLEKRYSDAANSAQARAGEIQAGAPLTRSTAPPRILWLGSRCARPTYRRGPRDRPGRTARPAGPGTGACGSRRRVGQGQYLRIDGRRCVLRVSARRVRRTRRADVEKHLLAVLGVCRGRGGSRTRR